MEKLNRDKLVGPGLAVLGAAALGWITRLPGGVLEAAESSVGTPVIVLGVGVALAPALYIALALSGAETSVGRFATGIGRGLRATGLAAIGFAGPLLFLVATTSSEGIAIGLGVLALFVAMIVGLMALWRHSVTSHTALSRMAFVLWSFSALAVGAHLLVDVLEAK